ncbi:NAD(+) diphosphatase [Raineyella sp. LH-20]|uniref:NAD(+) diphosphatase n=1 Tax=Raineyella sp. LH-20 TaxID=3081204 RepID=UPI0029545C32|nr:NAD(+) diphosphatase [Raineyella sp. LH-20]WOP20256.1 NAD(+) diphosphatase [Raineyella sp. LH-20]
MDWSVASMLDRSEEHRDDAGWVHRQWRSSDALLLPVGPGGRLPVAPGPALRYAATAGDLDPATTHLLGVLDGHAVFCRVVDEVTGETAIVREIGHRLAEGQAEVAFCATSLANWHRIEPRCAACGALTEPRRAGLMRHCPACGRDTWPRTDPAVIVAVTNTDDEILLAHQPVWAAGRVSVLAGFVETGESLEQAIHREILEEAGVRLGEVRYVASQPWPFPRSLMLGFRATAVTTRITVDAEELAWGRWFSRADVRAGRADGSLVLPPGSSIARRLIEDWLGEQA